MSGNKDHHRQGRRFAAGMTGVILAMSRLKDFVNGFVILKYNTRSGDEEEEYPFVNKYPSLQEPSMLMTPKFELLHTDQGDSLVIQRVLSVAPSKSMDGDSWRRNNIFRTKYNSNDKVCNMINDGGSCENAVSTYMVEKLALKTVGHPEPYQFTWLKKRNAIKVSKRCLVEFSARKKYKDKVWCEVIPMDACHILLGFKKIKIRVTVRSGLLHNRMLSWLSMT
nr:reverse transcriptase domain-containing protein [Tanacetum cinerariifolium]